MSPVVDQDELMTRAADAAARPVLDIRDLTRCFGGVVAVRGANMVLRPGQVTALIGPNGAGKTTLFNAITGCVPATSGTITFRGRDAVRRIERLRPDQIAALGIARTFQNIRLFSNLTALDNVKIGLHARSSAGVWGAIVRPRSVRAEERDVEAAARRHMVFCGLRGMEMEAAGSLPYGLQRRLEIARALATDPSLLLLDEPAAGMNPAESRDLLDLIRKVLGTGITVFLIEHDMRVVMNVSDVIHVLDHGEVIACGAPDVIRSNRRVIDAYLGEAHG